jgi:phage terminase large subunit GpA-like protein
MNEIFAVNGDYVLFKSPSITRSKFKRKIAVISPAQARVPNKIGNNLKFQFSYGYYLVPGLEELKILHLKSVLLGVQEEVDFIELLIHLTKTCLRSEEFLAIKI